MTLIVSPNGVVAAVYSELIELSQLGQPLIRRASHVEPDMNGQWWADLSPVQGPALGPFCNRSEALGAESAWLDERLAELP